MSAKKNNAPQFARELPGFQGSCDSALDAVGRQLARLLTRPRTGDASSSPSNFDAVSRTLEPGDVLLVEGRGKISTAIKYLTQSTWSHAALCVGKPMLGAPEAGRDHCLVEVDLGQGCILVPLSKYAGDNMRICRPVGLSAAERSEVVGFMTQRIGTCYDLRNIFDLARYFLPTPPVPVRWRRRMLSIGSGDPTRAICSSLIAQAFQSVRYPILPQISILKGRGSRRARKEVLHIRHHSLFTPRDFDLSPYFAIIKPQLHAGFDHRNLAWQPADNSVSVP